MAGRVRSKILLRDFLRREVLDTSVPNHKSTVMSARQAVPVDFHDECTGDRCPIILDDIFDDVYDIYLDGYKRHDLPARSMYQHMYLQDRLIDTHSLEPV